MLKRTVSLALAIVMIACALTSCDLLLGKDAATIISEADAALSGAEYTVNTTVVFTSDDETMKAAIADIDGTTMTFATKGHASRSTVAMKVGGVDVRKEYIISDGVLYYTHTETSGETTDEVKQQVVLSAEEKNEIISDTGVKAPLSYTDFSNVSVETSGNVSLITCEGIKANASVATSAALRDALGIDGAVVIIMDAKLVVRIVDGKYNGEYLSVSYSIDTGSASYDLRLQLSSEYDLTTSVSILPPQDSESYVSVGYSELGK